MIIEPLGYVFVYTWFIWAPVFVYNLIAAIKYACQPPSKEQEKKSSQASAWAAVSFSVIVGDFICIFQWVS